MDITDFLKFGEANAFILAQGNDWQGVDLRPGEAPESRYGVGLAALGPPHRNRG